MLRSHDNSILVTIANERAEIAGVVEALHTIGTTHGIPSEALVALQVSIDEVVSNVIKYAWNGGAHQVHVRISVLGDGVEVEVVDDGEPFNPLDAPPPPPSTPGERPAPGGIGIHMVRQLMDGIEYARNAGRNHTVLTKRCALQARR